MCFVWVGMYPCTITPPVCALRRAAGCAAGPRRRVHVPLRGARAGRGGGAPARAPPERAVHRWGQQGRGGGEGEGGGIEVRATAVASVVQAMPGRAGRPPTVGTTVGQRGTHQPTCAPCSCCIAAQRSPCLLLCILHLASCILSYLILYLASCILHRSAAQRSPCLLLCILPGCVPSAQPPLRPRRPATGSRCRRHQLQPRPPPGPGCPAGGAAPRRPHHGGHLPNNGGARRGKGGRGRDSRAGGEGGGGPPACNLPRLRRALA